MSRIYPSFSSLSKHSSLDCVSPKRETFTIWMKSLVLNGNGCTVYDSEGQIAYRVDNYDYKCRGEVYLMNFSGSILCRIVKKKLRICGRWEGHRYNTESQKEEMRPWFMVKKPFFMQGYQPLHCEVWGDTDHLMCCKIDEMVDSSCSCYTIVGISGELLAKVKRKQTESGVELGDDVLTLVVEPNIDLSLIMGLVVVHGLKNSSM